MYASLVSGIAIIQAVEAVASVKSWPINLKGWANSSQARSQNAKAATRHAATHLLINEQSATTIQFSQLTL